MAFTYFDFDFRYVGADGKPYGRTQRGNIKDDGLTLGEDVLYFHYIFDTAKDYDDLVLVLFPAIAAASSITDRVLKGTNALVLRLEPDNLLAVKSQIDRKYTALQAKLKREKMGYQKNLHNFRITPCPVCDATIDLSQRPDTPYIYCRYCETIFNKHRHFFTGADKYALCYECGYYSQVKHYSGLGTKDSKEFCINCAESHIGKDWTLVFKRPLHFFAKIQTQQEANPHFTDLDRANKLGRKGELSKAEVFYNNMLLHVKSYPAIHYNFGKAILDIAHHILANPQSAEDLAQVNDLLTRSAAQFEMSLKACCNYQPTLEILKKFSDLPYVKR